MKHVFVEWTGMAAALLTTLSWLPQALQTIRTRKTRDISLSAQLMLFAGLLLWLAYGLMLGSVPLIAANIVTSLLVAIILGMKLRNIRADSRPE